MYIRKNEKNAREHRFKLGLFQNGRAVMISFRMRAGDPERPKLFQILAALAKNLRISDLSIVSSIPYNDERTVGSTLIDRF